MFKNYLKVAFISLMRHKSHALINIFGLAIGIACFLLIGNYVRFEYGYDTYLPASENTYRLITNVKQPSGDVMNTALSSTAFSKTLTAKFPEILATTRLLPDHEANIEIDGFTYLEEGLIVADSSFFKVFPYSFILGTPESAFMGNRRVILTASKAEKFFGEDNPVGKTMRIGRDNEYTVSAVIEDIPVNTHLEFGVILSSDGMAQFDADFIGSLNIYSYALLQEGVDYHKMDEKLYLDIYDEMGENWAELIKFKLQPIEDIHFTTDREHELAIVSEKSQVVFLTMIALIILVIACINFMNLATAKSETRSKEVGMRKVVGANQSQLWVQFMTESFITVFIAVLLSLFIIHLILPVFQQIVGRAVGFNFVKDIPTFIGVWLMVSIIAGSYPAIYLAAVKPIRALKGTATNNNKGHGIRKVLVVFQFTVTVVLIIVTLIIYKQREFMENKDIGYSTKNIISLQLNEQTSQQNFEQLKSEFHHINGVNTLSCSDNIPGRLIAGQRQYTIQDSSVERGTKGYLIKSFFADHDFISLLDIELIAGRNFSKKFASDAYNAVIINEACMKRFGWTQALGQTISNERRDSVFDLQVIGVVKDFNFESLHTSVDPLILNLGQTGFSYLSIKVDDLNKQQTINEIADVWARLEPNHPFNPIFLEEDFNSQYQQEDRMNTVYSSFSLFAIIIACLGLFGMISFTIEKKRREIGIRKVLGASITKILIIINKEMFVMQALANVIAWPIAYYFAREWLNGYAYRASIGVFDFLIAALVALVISITTVSYISFKSANADPVKAIYHQ